MSSIVDWTDRSTCVLFGDGAGAAVLKRARSQSTPHPKGILAAYMRSDGTLADLLYRPAGGSTIPFSEAVLADRSHFVKMAGREVFKHAVRSMADATDRALDAAKLTGKDIDLLIPHRANVRIIEATAKHAGVSMEGLRQRRPLRKYFVASTVALDDHRAWTITEGTTVMLVAFGAGFTWASMIIRF